MLSQTIEVKPEGRPEILEIVQDLRAETRLWADAEMKLAAIELGELRRKAVQIAVFSVIGFAAAFCALTALSQAAIAFLAPLVGGMAFAALIVAGLLVLLLAVCALAVWSTLSWKPESLLFRWFSRPALRAESH